MLKHALYHSAAELVHAHFVDAGLESFNNELYFLRVDLFYNLLHNMIPIGVFNAFNDFRLNFLNNFILKSRR